MWAALWWCKSVLVLLQLFASLLQLSGKLCSDTLHIGSMLRLLLMLHGSHGPK